MRADDLKLLGLPADCSPEAIRRAYRKLALRWHPDTSTDSAAHERFQELVAAQERLLANDYPAATRATFSEKQPRNARKQTVRPEPEPLTPQQVFWRKTGRVIYRLFTPVLFVLLLLLTPVWLLLLPVIPWWLERKAAKRR
jgi:hypothetical protein